MIDTHKETFEGAVAKQYLPSEMRPQTADYIKRMERKSQDMDFIDFKVLMASIVPFAVFIITNIFN